MQDGGRGSDGGIDGVLASDGERRCRICRLPRDQKGVGTVYCWERAACGEQVRPGGEAGPVSVEEAQSMIDTERAALLRGYRNLPRADLRRWPGRERALFAGGRPSAR